jgi:hypothetical protein
MRAKFLRLHSKAMLQFAANHLTGQPQTEFFQQQADIHTLDDLIQMLEKGPYGSKDTDYSIREQLFGGRNSVRLLREVVNMITRVERLFSRAPTALTDDMKIFAVQFNSPNFFKSDLMVDGNGDPWTDYNAFRAYTIQKANASSRRGRTNERNPHNGEDNERSTTPGKRGRSSSRPGSDRAGPSNGRPFGRGDRRNRPADEEKWCCACRQRGHFVTDFINGKPVCKKYDPSKAGKKANREQK